MGSIYIRKYGVAATVNFVLYKLDGTGLKIDAAHVAGDTKIMKDEGAENNTTNGFVDEGQGYSLLLTVAEMQAARIVIYIVDAAVQVWLDRALVIETYGHASSQHELDLDSATVNLSAASETQIDNIEADTNELQGDWVNAGRLDAILDLCAVEAGGNIAAILADTATIAWGDITAIINDIGVFPTANYATVAAYVEDIRTRLIAIVGDTNELQTDWVNAGRLDAILDLCAVEAGGNIATIMAVTNALPNAGALNDLATILTDTNELQTDWTNAGRLDAILDLCAIEAGGNIATIMAVTNALPNAGALNDLATILIDSNELQTDWVNGGRLDNLLDACSTHTAANVWAVGVRTLTDLTGFSLSPAGIDAIIDEVIEGTITLRQATRLMIGVLASKSNGGGTGTLRFRDSGDAKNRVTATVDANGNRTNIVLDVS